jgi:hypothetical protein
MLSEKKKEKQSVKYNKRVEQQRSSQKTLQYPSDIWIPASLT